MTTGSSSNKNNTNRNNNNNNNAAASATRRTSPLDYTAAAPSSCDTAASDRHIEDNRPRAVGSGYDASTDDGIRRPFRRRRVGEFTTTLVRFWYDDLPPFHGPLRLAFYLMLWIVIVGWEVFIIHSNPTGDTFFAESCEIHVENLAHYRNLGFQYKAEGGVLSYFLSKLDDPSKFWMFDCVKLSWGLFGGLLLSAIGLGWKLPRIVTAISFWIMFAIRTSKWNGETSHSHYVAGSALISLCFAEDNLIDRWSVDAQLVGLYRSFRRRYPGGYRGRRAEAAAPPLPPPEMTRGWNGGPSAGGAARKFVLFEACCAMYFAGLHKLSTWGFRWMDGGTILRCLEIEHGHWPALVSVFRSFPILTTPLAVGSVVGEIGAVATLLSPWWRPYGIASFYVFHIGIFLLMQPNFICNEVTYILLVDWRQFLTRLSRRRSSGTTTSSTTTVDCPSSPLIKSSSSMSGHDDGQNASVSVQGSGGGGSGGGGAKANSQFYPFSMRIGAWIYSALAAAVFLTGLLRIDAFPFYSWSLYNWHPSEVGYRRPYTAEIAKEASHRCLTKPPFNPSCRNHGTTKHHDKLPGKLKNFLTTVVITADRSFFDNSTLGDDTEDECPLAVYVDWIPHSCWAVTSLASLHAELKAMLKSVSMNDPDDGMIPKELPISGGVIRPGLIMRATDAAAAAIDEGPSCFDAPLSSFSSGWIDDANLLNSASRFARHIRMTMSTAGNEEIYLSKGREILAVGMTFAYISTEPVDEDDSDSANSDDNGKDDWDWRLCMLGSSMIGENVTDTFSNHEEGATGIELPPGDWTEVIRGILFTVGLAYAIPSMPRWRPWLERKVAQLATAVRIRRSPRKGT